MYTHILVPLDGSSRSEKILVHVEGLAISCQSAVTLLKVNEIGYVAGFEGALVEMNSRVVKEMEDSAHAYLAPIVNQFILKDIACEARVTIGNPANSIIRTADQVQADLVAMASHGHSGLSRVFYGSVASAVLNRIDRPLLIIRARKDKSARDRAS